MDLNFPPPLGAALVAMLPAMHVWWAGRQLIRSVDDPALPERLAAGGQRRAFVIAVAIAVTIVLWTRHVVWALPLMIAGTTAASYPLRKALYGETWSLPRFLGFFGRLYLAVLGFWMLVALAPAIAAPAGRNDWIVAAGLAAFLLAWHVSYVDVVRRLLGAAPIEDPGLLSKFRRLVDECRLPAPALEQIRIEGGVVANAIALASRRGSAVIFTDTLLARLTPDEAEAICAHELAHLEQFTPAWLRREALFTVTLIVSGALVSPAARLYTPSWVLVLSYVWIAFVLLALGVRARARQAHETASDLRAAALTGNPEALVSALIRLHAIARVPRRWDADLERQATHPSLARRIQAIRAAAGAAPMSLSAATTFVAAGTSATVTFDVGRLVWTEGEAATHSVSYEQLVELRIDAGRAGTRLIVVDRTARRWEVPLGPDDVPRAQAVLDIVDMRLAKPAASRALQPAAVRLSLAVVALAALAAMQWGALFVAAVALFRPAARFVAAAAAAATAGGLLAWSTAAHTMDPRPWIALAMAVVAPVLIVAALRSVDEGRSHAARQATGLLAAALAIVWTLAAISAGSLHTLTLNHTMRSWPAASVLPVALAVALGWRRSGPIRYGAALLVAVGIGTGFAGSQLFLDRFVRDPLLVDANAVTVAAIDDAPVAEFEAPTAAHRLVLSEDARYVAIWSMGDRTTTLHIGRVGGTLARFDAEDAVFTSELRAILLGHARGAAVVWEVSLDPEPAIVAEHRVPGMAGGRLTVGDGSGRWQLIGWTGDDEIVAIEGDGNGGTLAERRWNVGESAEYLIPLRVGGGEALFLETRYELTAAMIAPMWWLRLTPFVSAGPGPGSRLWVGSADGARDLVSSRLAVECPGALFDDRAICTTFDGHRTRLVALGGATPVEGLFQVPGRFVDQGRASRGWITGWWQGRATAVRLDTGDAFQVDGRRGASPYQLAPADNAIGALTYDSGRSIVRLYPLPR